MGETWLGRARLATAVMVGFGTACRVQADSGGVRLGLFTPTDGGEGAIPPRYRISPVILFLDAAGTTGVAFGAPGSEPKFATRRFTGSGASGEVVARFRVWLVATIDKLEPRVVAFESPYIPAGNKGPPLNARTVRRLHAICGTIEAVCWERKISCYEAGASEITRFFTGQGSWGNRAKKKAATVAQARRYGWAVTDDNQADALAGFCYAESILDPVAAAQRRARLGLELALHPPNEDARQARSAGRRGSSVRHKKSGGSSNGRKADTATTGEFQFAAG